MSPSFPVRIGDRERVRLLPRGPPVVRAVGASSGSSFSRLAPSPGGASGPFRQSLFPRSQHATTSCALSVRTSRAKEGRFAENVDSWLRVPAALLSHIFSCGLGPVVFSCVFEGKTGCVRTTVWCHRRCLRRCFWRLPISSIVDSDAACPLAAKRRPSRGS